MAKKTELVATSPKVMKMEQALQFLVKLANTEIDELKNTPDDPGGLLTILYLLRRYLDVTGDGELKRALDRARRRPDDLKKSVADIRKLLAAMIHNNLDETKFRFSKPRKIRLGTAEGEFVMLRDGDLRESIVETAIEDLADTQVELLRVGHCHREGCDNFFYKVKLNQMYCDHQCANKAAAARRQGLSSERVISGTANKESGRKS